MLDALRKIVASANPGDAVYIVSGTNAVLDKIRAPEGVTVSVLSRAGTIIAEDNEWAGIRKAFGIAACGNTIIIPVGNLDAAKREAEGGPEHSSQDRQSPASSREMDDSGGSPQT